VVVHCDIIYLLAKQGEASDCEEQRAGGIRRREYRTATASFGKAGSVEVSAEVVCRTGLLWWEEPSEGLRTDSLCWKSLVGTGSVPQTHTHTRHEPGLWGPTVSQGHHLKRGQGPPGRGYVLFFPEQPQQDVFLILGPAVDVSVLKPGGHVLLWEREGQE